MGNIYTETIRLRSVNCDLHEAWKPSAILETMQETAGAHAAAYGLDHASMTALGVAWVLTRLKVDFSRLPRTGEKIEIETYPTPVKHMFYPRSHIFRDEQGEIIGVANSLWVTMDIGTRKIVKNETVLSRIPGNEDMEMVAGMPASVRPLGGDAQTGCITPGFTDLDVNVHVNNTKYLDWCLNALGLEVMDSLCLTAFDVSYDAEIRPGCEIRTELTCQDDRIAFCGFDGDRKHFSIGGRLAKR